MYRRPAPLPTVAFLLTIAASFLASPARAADPTPEVATGESVTLADGTVLPPMPVPMEPTVHAQMLAEHADDAIEFTPGGAPTVLLSPGGGIEVDADASSPDLVTTEIPNAGGIAALPNGLRKEVLGFLPYWVLNDAALAYMNYNLVSTIAYFSVGAKSDGNLDKGTSGSPSSGWAGWTGSRMTQVIDRAHAEGVKVVLTVTMMAWDDVSWARMATLLNSSTNRARLTSQIVDAVRTRGADGVNLDFELVPNSLRSQYTSFVRQVKAALVAADVGDYVTVCTTGGAATWATGYDVPGLVAAGAADGIFVMGYDFHWSGSSRAGGVGPLDSPYTLDVSTALADFLEQAPAAKLIWGVPYYGRSWTTTTNQLNGLTTGASWSYYYTGHRAQAATYGRLWDAVGKVPWYRYWDSGRDSWVQSYYDDAVSLGYKYDLVNRYGLAGTGMWHLLMDNGRDELWRLIADRFVTDTAPPAGGITVMPQTTDMSAAYVSWHAIDYASGVNHYTVQVRDRNVGVWSNWLIGTRAKGAYYFGTPGRTYEFRVRAIDWKGNAQPWLEAPGMAPTVRPGSFARVTTGTLNVRSGPSTTYGIVDTLSSNDRVYVLSGPVTAAGYTWFQVQYGFAQWPSADYARIGWAALGGGGSTYLAPAYAPSVTRVDPFVSGYGRQLTEFSPNGDGVRDGVTVSYRLRSAVSGVRVDVVEPDNDLVRRFTLGPQAAGLNSVTWNGRTDSGAWASNGRYLVKVFATDGTGVTHAAPVAGNSATVMARWGVTADRGAPSVTGVDPGAAELTAATWEPTIVFSELMTALRTDTVTLERVGGSAVDVDLAWNAAIRTLTISPESALQPNAAYRIELGPEVMDVAGNPLGAWTSTFAVAPGTPYPAGRALRVQPGTYSGYVIGDGGDLRSVRRMAFPTTSGATVIQRAPLPNLPGRWLYVANGAWAGMWVVESPGTSLAGETERATWPATTRVSFAGGSHTGYRFNAAGVVTASATHVLGAPSGANTTARAIINGRAYWYVTNGAFSGYWLPESARLYLRGAVAAAAFNPQRVSLAAGGYTGYTFDAAWRVTGSVSSTLPQPSGASVDRWAVINGRGYYHVVNGIWAGTWVLVDSRIALAP